MSEPTAAWTFREEDVRRLWEAMREITFVSFASDADMWDFAQAAVDALPIPDDWKPR